MIIIYVEMILKKLCIAAMATARYVKPKREKY